MPTTCCVLTTCIRNIHIISSLNRPIPKKADPTPTVCRPKHRQTQPRGIVALCSPMVPACSQETITLSISDSLTSKWIDHPAHKKASLFTFDLNRRATVSPLFTKPPPAPDSLIKTTAWTTNSFVGAPQFSDRHSHLLAPPMSLFSIDRQNQNR